MEWLNEGGAGALKFRFTGRLTSPIFAALMLPIVIKILLVVHVLVSVLIVLLVLMQRPKNEGLGAAFGGGMTDNLFGAQTTNVLQTITRWLGALFFALTVILSLLYVRQGGGRSSVQEKLSAPTTIPATPAPSPLIGTPGADGREPLKFELTPGGTVIPVQPGTEPAPAPGTEATPAPAPAGEAPKAPAEPAAPAAPDAPKADGAAAPESAPAPAEPAK